MKPIPFAIDNDTTGRRIYPDAGDTVNGLQQTLQTQRIRIIKAQPGHPYP